MIQFISNHPIWTGIIIYLIIGFILSIQYYCLETYHHVTKRQNINDTKEEVLKEHAGMAFIHIFLWVILLIADIWDLDTIIYNRYDNK